MKTKTITEYRPGIYGELAARAARREAREERVAHLLTLTGDIIFMLSAVVFLAWSLWFAFASVGGAEAPMPASNPQPQ